MGEQDGGRSFVVCRVAGSGQGNDVVVLSTQSVESPRESGNLGRKGPTLRAREAVGFSLQSGQHKREVLRVIRPAFHLCSLAWSHARRRIRPTHERVFGAANVSFFPCFLLLPSFSSSSSPHCGSLAFSLGDSQSAVAWTLALRIYFPFFDPNLLGTFWPRHPQDNPTLPSDYRSCIDTPSSKAVTIRPATPSYLPASHSRVFRPAFATRTSSLMENVPPPPGLGWAARGTKRTHSQMSGSRQTPSRRTRSPSAISTNDNSTPTHSTSSNPSVDPGLQPTSSFFRLDPGSFSLFRLPSIRELDAARPPSVDPTVERPRSSLAAAVRARTVAVEAPMDVIDLTNDDDYVEFIPPRPRRQDVPGVFGHAQRGPRFPAEIIDLSGDTPQRPWREQERGGESGDNSQNEVHNGSPEVQFVRARPLSPRLRFAGVTPPAHRLPDRLTRGPIEIPDDDEIEIIEERLLPPQVPLPPPGRIGNFIATFGTATRILQDVGLIARAGGASHRASRRGPRPHPQPHQRARAQTHVQVHNFDMPNLDFGFAAFDLGYGREEPRTEREESVVPAPNPAPEGFTRNPTEEDVLVCPNCDAELSMGESDVKRQVWLVKTCGHIYCGECAASRLATKPRKGKEPVNQKYQPLKKCVVEGCVARTTGKQMIQLFL
ncbi:uncharacterized protein PV09_05150 [Verruconis gallopava]|uniref:RING-type domain-containing protein n=1 Tax=Verruconis gallopava TaxID=253628 RepID=A0A0D1XMQ9_9PEZI|nr:uncharacterized protein PV09_05150 [Verruconis gallopava]KIW03851.1 hypothetical protein PV09_05150 [Verruconis gallopava]